MNSLKVIAMLMGLWGFSAYIYQNYVDDLSMKRKQRDTNANGTQLTFYIFLPFKVCMISNRDADGLVGFSTYIYQNYVDDLRMKRK
ncbi:hypothetical protein Ccrd_008744 [Cynara cardunculus var. scolymus]|uniref:Uncharacterized protein n=1 Tax=Cynara cardunculus var. scolymus TaxID=59895 RepID=A0A103XEI0_CYNCS|nr:hypothetical protein Ccrd_008744 [Cynara cardunculus var. scolymus]